MNRTRHSSRRIRRQQHGSRGQPARAAPDRADGVSIPRAFLDAGDQVHYFRRNLADAVIHIPTTDRIFAVDYMPGFNVTEPGTPWITVGGAATDIGNPNALYAPFTCQFTLDSLSQYTDINSAFAEFQVVAVKYSFRTSFGQSALASTGGMLPEVWSAAFPISTIPANDLAGVEALNPKRKVLGPDNVLTHVVAPRALFGNGTDPSPAYATLPSAWYNTTTPSQIVFAGIQCALRNFYQTANSGVTILCRAEAFLKVRRWQ
jgi:hypothetical protein